MYRLEDVEPPCHFCGALADEACEESCETNRAAPECTCRPAEGLLFSAVYCEFHDPNSKLNRVKRQGSMIEKYYGSIGEVA